MFVQNCQGAEIQAMRSAPRAVSDAKRVAASFSSVASRTQMVNSRAAGSISSALASWGNTDVAVLRVAAIGPGGTGGGEFDTGPAAKLHRAGRAARHGIEGKEVAAAGFRPAGNAAAVQFLAENGDDLLELGAQQAGMACHMGFNAAFIAEKRAWRSWLSLSGPMVANFHTLRRSIRLAELAATPLMPAPGKETLLVEQNSYTISGCPALAQADRMSGRTAGALG